MDNFITVTMSVSINIAYYNITNTVSKIITVSEGHSVKVKYNAAKMTLIHAVSY